MYEEPSCKRLITKDVNSNHSLGISYFVNIIVIPFSIVNLEHAIKNFDD